jgi:multidrug resistance efflux pump
LLSYLDGKVRFLFTRSFLALSALVILTAFGITLTNSQEIGRELLRASTFETLLLAWFVVFAVTAAHEFAHGLTCKHFGGAVHEIGFLLIYLQPAFYCNVSDAWLFPEKSKRLWVTFAGAYLEVFIWALAILTWRVTELGTTVNYVALVVLATSGVKTLFNLNPLIKLDGYYLLSDAVGIPNLRQRAFAYLGARLRRLWSAAPAAGTEPTPRERRIYTAYGLLAGTFSFLLLGLVVVQLGQFLVGRYQALGFILFTGLLALVFRHPLGRAARKIPLLFGPGTWGVASVKRRVKALALVAAAAVALFLFWMELTVSGEFKILPMHNADVRAEVEGIIESVHADESDVVAKGALIARLSGRDYTSELRKTEAEIGEKQAKLKMLVAGPRREEIALARDAVVTAKTRVEHARNRHVEAERMRVERLSRSETSVEKARERVTYAQRLLDMHQTIFQRELIALKQLIEAQESAAVRKKELEEAQAELKLVLADDLAEPRKTLAVAEKELREAEAKLNILLAGSRPEEIEATRAELARLETQRRYRAEQLQLATVMSPIAGVVTTPKLREKIGQHVKKGDLIAEVHELRTVRAEISVPESEIGDVKVGQPVVLKARAYPERSFRGVVTAIGAAATKEDGRSIVRVTTVIDNPGNLLKAELTGNAKIHGDQQRLFDLMTRRLARYIRVEFWSWW